MHKHTRRDFIKAAGCSLLSAQFAGGLSFAQTPAGGEKPNIIFILIDDMGYADPSCFGNPVMKTPNMDKLAKQGIRLTNFYVNAPVCSPTRVGLTTGQYPTRWGIHSYIASSTKNDNRNMADFLDLDAPSLARILKGSGYATAHIGKWHMGGGRDVDYAPFPSEYGFDESYVNFEGLGDRVLINGHGLSDQSGQLGKGDIKWADKHELTGIYVDKVIDFISRNKDKNFFINLWPDDVHTKHLPEKIGKWKNVTDNPHEQKFFAVLENLDEQIGRLMNALDSHEVAEDTLVVLVSDNGPTDGGNFYSDGWNPPGFTGKLRGRKLSLYEGGIRMPFIARWPGRIKAGSVNRKSVLCGMDMLPTLCSIAGAEVPESANPDGLNMSGALLGEAPIRDEPIFWHCGEPFFQPGTGSPFNSSPSLAVRDGDWKFLINPDGSEAQLYNLSDDISEQNNLFDQKPAKVSELWAKIRAWASDVGVPVQNNTPTRALDPVTIDLGKSKARAINTGVEVSESQGQQRFCFDGGSCLDVFIMDVPRLEDSGVMISAEAEPEAENGVLLAQGGGRTGYSLYLDSGKPAFCVCIAGSRTTITSSSSVPDGKFEIAANLKKNGRMELFVNGQLAASGQADSAFTRNAGDSLQIGADLISQVGSYTSENWFKGCLSNIRISAI
ncbi:sulfatase-like hydrolase/transferase [Sedimentisphaera salicampi]|uniref:sulfatase-like hydrolase/transferase n=1 Tax=Sedimentisphaera salicampi TaxID=1941349 RepID=UPI000B9BD3D7|nr:sulfatase-like hydrolase/transferase [Sedimentisphaera salicampi]OXU14597.1 Arylsulfatase [Sedimentisphaera salicampi]